MLWQKLLGANAAGGLEFVGGATATNSSSSAPTFALSGRLSGGLATSPAAGDLVIAAVGFVNSTDRTITALSSGWTQVADLYANDVADTQLGVFYKYLTAADANVQFSLGVTTLSRFAVHVWRKADSSSPLDATTTTATRTANSAPDAPSITTVTDQAVVIAVGVGAAHSASSMSLTVPSGMENFFKSPDPTASDIPQIVIASIFVSPAGAYNPPVFGGNRAGTGNTACAATLAIRPE
jgi:hypothetical protein